MRTHGWFVAILGHTAQAATALRLSEMPRELSSWPWDSLPVPPPPPARAGPFDDIDLGEQEQRFMAEAQRILACEFCCLWRLRRPHKILRLVTKKK